MLLFAILAVFIAGLMVGRTPEYIGKKIEQKEVKMAMLALIATAFTSWSSPPSAPWPIQARTATGTRPAPPSPISPTTARTDSVRSSTPIPAPRETTAAPLADSAPTRPGTTSSGLAMLIGRFLFIIPCWPWPAAWRPRRNSRHQRDLPTHGPLFCRPVGGDRDYRRRLTFFPALSLGPIVEHFLMQQGKLFLADPLPIWS